jgi:O-antigen/teichoic acid export membrane protein
MTLSRQTATGTFWVGVSTAARTFFRVLTNYILARMLLPGDFGLVAMAGLAIDFLQMFRDMGFSSALIYHKGEIRKAADTTFILLILIAIVLVAVALIAAPFVAAFYRTPELTSVVRVLSLNILVSAFGQVQLSLLAKNLAFRERLLPDLVPIVVYGVVAVLLALMGLGVWSLVIANLVSSFLTSVLAWLVAPWWRPRLRFDRQIAKELFDYGVHIVGSSWLVFFITNLDNTFIGRVLGKEPLGYYGLAYSTANLPATHISRIIGQVLFPAYSRIQDDMVALRRVFFRTLHYVSLLSIPLAVGMITFAAPFILTLYGDRWAPSIVPLQLLGIYGLLRSVAVNMGSVFKAGGKPNWLTGIALARLAIMGILLYPATRYYGIVGVSAVSAVVSIADFIVSAALTNRIIHGRFSDYVASLWAATLFSVVSALAARWSYVRISGGHGLIGLLTAGMLMVLLYASLVFVFDQEVRRLAMASLSAAQRAGREFMDSQSDSL